MRPEHNEFKVGLTVAAVVLLFVIVMGFVGKWNALFTKTNMLHVRFDHQQGIDGLRIEDPVRVGGVNVGRVRAIYHAEDPKTGYLYVHVLADVPENIHLHPDCRISIGTKFVGEGGTLDILSAGETGEILTENDVVDGLPPVGIAELTAKLSREFDETNPEGLLAQIKQQLDVGKPQSLLAKIHKSLDDINAISAGIRRQADPELQTSLMARIHQTVNNLNDLTGALRGEFNREDKQATLAKVDLALATLNDALASAKDMLAENRPKVQQAVDHVQRTAQRLDEQISTALARELNPQEKDSLLAKLHVSLTAAQAGMENLRALTQTGKELVGVNRDSLQSVVDNFAETSAHLKATAKELRLNPWRLLYRPEKAEIDYANLLAATRAFSDAAASLDNANGKLTQLMQLEPQTLPAADPQFIQIREQVKEAFCQFEQAQEKLWELLKLRK